MIFFVRFNLRLSECGGKSELETTAETVPDGVTFCGWVAISMRLKSEIFP
jgi:hypothetical protein